MGGQISRRRVVLLAVVAAVVGAAAVWFVQYGRTTGGGPLTLGDGTVGIGFGVDVGETMTYGISS
jgi:hypothetical protein